MKMRERYGFTVVEMLVVLVVGTILALALHQAYVQHSRFLGWQERVVGANDAFRVAGALLSADLREAVPRSGDLTLSASDRLVVRAPTGLAFVCATLSSPPSLGLTRVLGRLPEQTGDSIMVYATTGWRVSAVVARDTPGQNGLSCGGRAPEAQLRLPSGGTTSVPVGAPVRVFRRHTYHTVTNAGAPWLARTDAAGTEPLVGPLGPSGLRFRLLSETGAQTAVDSLVAGVELRLVLPSRAIPGTPVVPGDTATTVFQVRNR